MNLQKGMGRARSRIKNRNISWMINLLRDRSNFSMRAIHEEWSKSDAIDFSNELSKLDLKDTTLVDMVVNEFETVTMQINELPIYPSLECEHKDCFELADYIILLTPGPLFQEFNYIKSSDVEGKEGREGKEGKEEEKIYKVGFQISLTCTPHLHDFTSIFDCPPIIH